VPEISDNTKPAQPPYSTGAGVTAEVRAQLESRSGKSYLNRGVDTVTSVFVSNDKTREEVNHYATGFVKTIGLFAKGPIGLAGTVTAYALDAMDPNASAGTQALDGTLGAAKGALLKGTFSLLGKKELPVATKGMVLGIASNAVETGLTRSTYLDRTSGEFSLTKGLSRIVDTSFNPTSILTNAAVFTAAHGAFRGTDALTGGLIKRSPLLANVTNGFSFGMVSGAGSEIMRQRDAGEQIDLAAIAKKSLIQGGVDSIAAIPGGVQSDAAFRKHAVDSVQSTYYRTRWAMREGHTEARRLTYAALNKYDLRHPLQRMSNFIQGTADGANVSTRAPLTPKNNPITAFENEFPRFLDKMARKEQSMLEAEDRTARFAIHDEMGVIRTDFATRLLTLWHGTSKEPGIVSYKDAELATSNAPAQRVAQIRHALTLTARADYPSLSPLTQALTSLAPEHLRADIGKNHELLGEIGKAKEKFFGYDERELTTRMSMPAEVYYKKRAYGTPVNWLPFQATQTLANYFHGTVSNSLPSILTERSMLPASELRLRGITQATGESAGQEFPRRAISITTDFDEAWAYTRHSPDYLTGHPIVIGISQNVASKARPAGMLEPGEILVPKLRLGESLLTKLGLRKPEITHIYAPDMKVADITRQLAAHRIKGVRVVGLNELKAPQYDLPKASQD
jgi:hypothetical protein